MNLAEISESERPSDVPVFMRGGRLFATCSCGLTRPAFCIVQLSQEAATIMGKTWACDGCLTEAHRDPEIAIDVHSAVADL